jgi:hypothetical protein
MMIKYPEMEFLNGIFSRCFWAFIHSSLLRLEFLSGFPPHFSVLQNAIHEYTNRHEFSCFVNFLPGFLKPEKSMAFLKIRQHKGLGQKT